MKSKTFFCALTAASLAFSSLAFAQGPGHDRGNHGRPGPQARNDHDRRDDHRGPRDHGRAAPRADHYYYGARGPEWRRGGHVPPQYRSRQYVVTDWRAHRLSAPPRGHQWVQVGSDYVLMAVATGLIVNLLINQ